MRFELDSYFNIMFFTTETILYAFLMIKLLYYKISQHKEFTTAGVCYFFSILFFMICGLTGLYPLLFDDHLGVFALARSFLFIAALIYLQIYFYKMPKNFQSKNSITIIKKNCKNHIKAKTSMYSYSIILFVIETLCIPFFSNSGCHISFYEIIPAVCLFVFLIYQFSLITKITNNFIIVPWIIFTISMIMFLNISFIIKNFAWFDKQTLSMARVFFRTAQLFTLGYISVIKKNDLEVCLK